jgi:hypothetical protein
MIDQDYRPWPTAPAGKSSRLRLAAVEIGKLLMLEGSPLGIIPRNIPRL